MKRKIINLSSFNYKRRCSILKEDINNDNTMNKRACFIYSDTGSSSEDELIMDPVFKKACKTTASTTTCSSSKSREKNIKKNNIKKRAIFDTSSDDDMENVCFAERLNVSEKPCSSLSLNTVQTELASSFEKDDTDYKLGVLKGIFKDAYTEEMLLDAVRDTNGLDHAIAVLLGSTKEEGENNLVTSAPQTSKEHKQQLATEDTSPHNELNKLSSKQIERTAADNFNHVQNLSNNNDSVENDLKELIKHFPEYDKTELQEVLKANSFCLEDAIGAVELLDSSPVKLKFSKHKSKRNRFIDFDDVIDCVVTDDNSEVTESIDAPSAPLEMYVGAAAITVSDDDDYMYDGDDDDDNNDEAGDDDDNDVDCDLSDGEQDLAMSSMNKASILSLLDGASIAELTVVKGCSLTKAKKICSLRPFVNWNDLLEKIRNIKCGEELLWECRTFVKERDKMDMLMDKCEQISKDIMNLFEVSRSNSEKEISKSMLVLKEQYVTKEPSLVAPGLKLKHYQLTGLNWLVTMHKRGLNGILADEMGLGKTIQAIVFLAYLMEHGENGPHLIIVPSSTCENWRRELEKWCPSIRILHYTGSPTERRRLRDEVLDSEHDFQVIVTTYNMAISSSPDRAFLRKLEFNYAIYDEAHMLKNMKTQRYGQLLRIQPRRMLMLTGTPIQNNLMELMSLLTFVMPNMFADRIEGIQLLFGETKMKEIKKSLYRKEKVIQAKHIMEPFVMRRIKKDVLGDSLPEKHEHIVEIDLPSRQRKVYDGKFASFCIMRNSGEWRAPCQDMTFMVELRKAANHSLLMRNHYTEDMLSQMARNYCKDPSHRDSEVKLVFEDMEVMSDFELSRLSLNEHCLKDFHLPDELIMDSGKFLYLDSVLPKMKKEGDRVLLFNQFVMMMDIVEIYLKTRGYKYLRFDGTTTVDARQGLIDKFYAEEDIFIFLLSTKAGGLGINLVPANVVILYDSDYNPHNDKQAEDRCHRLGQTREVNVYRLVCKDTIEKTILNCANDKIRLHEDISGNKDSNKDNIQGLVSAVFAKKDKQEQ